MTWRKLGDLVGHVVNSHAPAGYVVTRQAEGENTIEAYVATLEDAQKLAAAWRMLFPRAKINIGRKAVRS